MEHTPVLLPEVITALNPKPGDVCVDGTVGGGGHAAELVRRSPGGMFLGIDWNKSAVTRVREKLTALVDREGLAVTVNVVQGNFSRLEDIVREELSGKRVDCLLLDLGLSSYELEEKMGFSYREDAPLIMRYDEDTAGLTAARVVNEYDEKTLAHIFSEYGEERFAGRIAGSIVRERRKQPLYRTGELVQAVERALPHGHHSRRHAALRTFLALRLFVNKERENLESALAALPRIMAPQGRAAIISFHSLEDRIVKQALKLYGPPRLAASRREAGSGKPIRPGPKEIARNPRSRSAKLRIAMF